MAKQLEFKKTKGWGGKRKGSGRKNRSGTVNHMTRPKVQLKNPLHITLGLKEKIPTIRTKFLLKEFKESVAKAREQGFYIIHYSIQNDHIHLFAEAENNKTLALGMRSLAGRFAKIIRQYAASKNRAKSGSVFDGRYHLHVLKTPTEVKNALEYVLLNLSKHQKVIEYFDHFSSAANFRDWKKLLGKRFRGLIRTMVENIENEESEESALSRPQSWLASKGWMKACCPNSITPQQSL